MDGLSITHGHTSHRVVITGFGALTNLGLNASSTWDSMKSGRSGISSIEGEEFTSYDRDHWDVTIAGQIKGWDVGSVLDPREAKRLDRFAQLGIGAAHEAVLHSGIDLSKKIPNGAESLSARALAESRPSKSASTLFATAVPTASIPSLFPV